MNERMRDRLQVSSQSHKVANKHHTYTMLLASNAHTHSEGDAGTLLDLTAEAVTSVMNLIGRKQNKELIPLKELELEQRHPAEKVLSK